jgi:predicted GIY-YIG superfamily endonuclease
VVCRAIDNALQSPHPTRHCTEEVFVKHNEQAEKLLMTLDLYEPNELVGAPTPVHPVLRATKHYPPACGTEGIISPCSGRLFALHGSSDNVQWVTGAYFSSRYLAKYVASIDEHNRVQVGAGKYPDELKLDQNLLHNTKITGNAMQEKKKHDESRDAHHPNSRAISIPEQVSIPFGYEQIFTTFKFHYCPTVPMEERLGVDKVPRLRQLQDQEIDLPSHAFTVDPDDLDSSLVIPSHAAREAMLEFQHDFPVWRTLSYFEQLTLKDQLHSPVSVDAITIFSVRPPELRFVDSPKLYFEWFYRSTQNKKQSVRKTKAAILSELSFALESSPWIDGFSCRVYVRPDAVPLVCKFITYCAEEAFYGDGQLDDVIADDISTPKLQTKRLFNRLEQEALVASDASTRELSLPSALRKQFICPPEQSKIPIVWYNSVNPALWNRFLLHILLSMGRFCTEVELLLDGNFRNAFFRAGLLGTESDEQSIKNIMRRYVVEQLVFMPGGSYKFDKHLLCAYSALRRGILGENLEEMDSLPPALYTKLQHDTSVQIKKHIEDTHRVIAETTLADLRKKGISPLPSLQEVLNRPSSPFDVPWNADLILQGSSQPNESFQEQKQLLKVFQNKLTQYASAETNDVKNLIITGGPGTGKTTVEQIMLLMAMTIGLLGGISAIMAVRAKQLGHEHLCRLFCIPVNENASVARLAELALIHLFRLPKRVAYLRQLDILGLDEFGILPVRMLAVIDIILRRLRDSHLFMGGVLLVCTMDHLQIQAIKDQPVLLSPHILTCFDMFVLHWSVRASQDVPLQRIQDLTRLMPHELTPMAIQELKGLMKKNFCFVDKDEDAPTDYVRVFGHKEATRVAEKKFLATVLQKHGNNTIIRHSIDTESTPEGTWIQASKVSSQAIDRKAREPSLLYFYPRANYEVTFNATSGRFSQSQLVTILQMPAQSTVDKFESIQIFLAPSTCQCAPNSDEPELSLTDQGWQRCQIGTAPERSHALKYGIQGRRKQYGLKHRISMTIHTSMGQTLNGVISRVTRKGVDPIYSLWLPSQVVVLLSRTEFAYQTVFIGSPDETCDAIIEVLQKQSQYSEYLARIIDALSGSLRLSPMPSILNVPQFFPFRACDLPLPTDCSGVVYLLISKRDRKSTYIGKTRNLSHRLVQHNSGLGSKQTAHYTLRPWAVLAVICGFEGNNTKMLRVEAAWKIARHFETQRHGPMTPQDVSELGELLVATNVECIGLRYVKCGMFHA